MLQEVPDTVVIAFIGRSNGAGPVLSALSAAPVITVPASVKDFPEDVWSSLRAPSSTPVMTVLEPSNAVLAALQILSGRNPTALRARPRRDRKSDGEYDFVMSAAAANGTGGVYLLAEIDRLKAELSVPNGSIADLEARADVDPLLDIFNRRGFERELDALARLREALRHATRCCSISISTASNRSTTGTATPPAMRCSRRWRRALTGHVRASDVVGAARR